VFPASVRLRSAGVLGSVLRIRKARVFSAFPRRVKKRVIADENVDILRKPQIIFEAERRNLDTSGTVNDIRRRLSRYLDELRNVWHESDPESDGPEPAAHASHPTGITPTTAPPTPLDNGTSHSKAMNQIRKWGCHFDGHDLLSFLERVTELQHQYHYSNELILEGLPELLRGKALL